MTSSFPLFPVEVLASENWHVGALGYYVETTTTGSARIGRMGSDIRTAFFALSGILGWSLLVAAPFLSGQCSVFERFSSSLVGLVETGTILIEFGGRSGFFVGAEFLLWWW